MYTSKNYKTKKALKDDVARRNLLCGPNQPDAGDGNAEARQREFSLLTYGLAVYQPNGDITGSQPPTNGEVYLEGPHYPEPHRWYAQATIENGVVVKVR